MYVHVVALLDILHVRKGLTNCLRQHWHKVLSVYGLNTADTYLYLLLTLTYTYS